MKVLLLNPNRYHNPPVPPIGLEYLVSPLTRHGHETFIVDLCFSDNVFRDIDEAIEQNRPGLIGITIRNIDTSQYPHTEFFLDKIKNVIDHLKSYEFPIVIGGAGFTAMPAEILRFLGADYGIIGPGEGALPGLVNKLGNNEPSPPLLNGWDYGFDPELSHRRGSELNYGLYREKGGMAGFETQKGCSGSCIYCVEAQKPHLKRSIPQTVSEIRSLAGMGNKNFHLCDSEFNIDLSYSVEFCKALAEASLSIRWSLYMKPEPVSEELFSYLKISGADVITLTVNSYELGMPEYRNSVARCVELSKKERLTLVIDLLIGFPFESTERMTNALDFFRIHRPDSVGVNYSIRIAPGASLFDYFVKNPHELAALIGSHGNENALLHPVFYQHPCSKQIQEWVADDPLFRIEGVEAGTNYQRFMKNQTD